MPDNAASPILQAVEALRRADRDLAVSLLQQALREGAQHGLHWKSVAKLAATIGEIDLSLEASRRFAATPPASLERRLHYLGELAHFGRSAQVQTELQALPSSWQAHEAVLHFLGSLSGEQGDFAAAEAHYRGAIARSPLAPQSWFALAMLKRFDAGDPDLAAMVALRPSVARMAPDLHARYLYGLAKAHADIGDHDQAFALYGEGAALRRGIEPYPAGRLVAMTEALIRDFTPTGLKRLVPADAVEEAVIFVNGLPRSGTTLVEQMLTSHSAVVDGGELNLVRAALIPTGDYSMNGALAYQQRMARHPDPWGKLASDYRGMLAMRFGPVGRVVDKTLVQSHYMGLLLHALPNARVIWMRRDPADVALSCYRTYFTSSVPWSWSLRDIAHFMALEDRLHAHWSALFPDRILTVPYEALVHAPEQWMERVLSHVGLPPEPGVMAFHGSKRAVRTASVQQVRAPISTTRIGQAQALRAHLAPFHEAYGR